MTLDGKAAHGCRFHNAHAAGDQAAGAFYTALDKPAVRWQAVLGFESAQKLVFAQS